MSCDTNGPIRKAYCRDDVTKNPKRLVPSLMGFVRVRVCARAGSQARGDRDFFCARVKKGFFGGFLIGKKRDTKNEIKNVSKWGLLWWSRKCLQVTIDRKYLPNWLEISKKFLLPVIIKTTRISKWNQGKKLKSIYSFYYWRRYNSLYIEYKSSSSKKILTVISWYCVSMILMYKRAICCSKKK